MPDLKQVIKQQFLECMDNPEYFMRKYCVIQHPKKGKIKFDLYDFQEKTLYEFIDNQELHFLVDGSDDYHKAMTRRTDRRKEAIREFFVSDESDEQKDFGVVDNG